MPDGTMTLYDYRVMLAEKVAAGVSQIRVTTALSALPALISPEDRSEITDDRQAVTEDFLKTNAEWRPRDIISVDTNEAVHVEGLFVGTKEAAALLQVERPRIGKYQLAGKMPKPVAKLGSGPIWLRAEVEDMRGWVESQRKAPRSRSTA